MRLARLIGLVSLIALFLAPAAFALRFTDDSYNTPTGVVGEPYSHKFDGDGGCGPDAVNQGLPYQFRVLSGGLPPGLSLAKNGLLSGVPTQAGEFSFWVELSDENPPSADWCRPATAERAFTVRIEAGLAIQQPSVPSGTVGLPYGPIQFTASGGGSQRWSASGLPAGLTLSASGVLSGTPTAKTGDAVVAVRVEDGARSSVRSFPLPIRDPLRLTSPSARQAEVGRPLSLRLTATGGTEQYAWEVAPAELPAGLTLVGNGSTRVLAGKPEIAGAFALKFTVKDTEGRAASVDVPLAIAPQLTIAGPTFRTAKANKRYTIQFRVRGGVQGDQGIEWRLLRFRPFAKISWNKATGRLSFVPHPKRNRYTIVVRATDALKARSTQTLTLTVRR